MQALCNLTELSLLNNCDYRIETGLNTIISNNWLLASENTGGDPAVPYIIPATPGRHAMRNELYFVFLV